MTPAWGRGCGRESPQSRSRSAARRAGNTDQHTCEVRGCGIRINTPAPGEAGAAATPRAAVRACGMLRVITRLPVPTVPTARLRLGCGGSENRLTWAGRAGLGSQPAPRSTHRAPGHPEAPHGLSSGCGEGGDTCAGGWLARPCLSFPTHAVAEVTRGCASARGPAISEMCPDIAGTTRLSHRPGTEGTPQGQGGAALPGLPWALPCSPPPWAGTAQPQLPGRRKRRKAQHITSRRGSREGNPPRHAEPPPTLAPRRSWSMVFSASAYLVSSLW